MATRARRETKGRSSRRRAWRALMELHGTVIPRMDEDLRAQVGLDVPTYDVLLHVYEAGEEGIRMSDLAARVVVSKSGLTSVVDRLEDRGLLRRTPDPADRRATRIRMTEQGEEAFDSAASVHIADINRYFADRLTDQEAEVIARALERIRGELLSE